MAKPDVHFRWHDERRSYPMARSEAAKVIAGNRRRARCEPLSSVSVVHDRRNHVTTIWNNAVTGTFTRHPVVRS